VSRNAATWADEWADQADRRPPGAGGSFYVIGPDGYARYRARPDWPAPGRTTLVVESLMAATGAAEGALWHYLFGVDLVDDVAGRARPVDETLRWRLGDPRAFETTSARDFLWLRILDVPAALTARHYPREERLVLDVVGAPAWVDRSGHPAPDPAAGRWVLETGPDGASCRAARSSEEADLRLGVAQLGAVLLGGQDLAGRAAAGLVGEDRPGVIDRADALFSVRPGPFSATGF
jgi:predicted acetyltransferase